MEVFIYRSVKVGFYNIVKSPFVFSNQRQYLKISYKLVIIEKMIVDMKFQTLLSNNASRPINNEYLFTNLLAQTKCKVIQLFHFNISTSHPPIFSIKKQFKR